MESITLRNGVEMPKIGYGVFQISKDDCARCVREAIETGYRHIDTAQSYFNESEVGDGIAQSGIDRADLFVTTKIWISNYGYENTLKSVEVSLRKLKTDYLDLVLLHQPFSDYYGAWHALEKLHREGVVRAIGVSNFYPDRLVDLALHADVVPAVDQIEVNPFDQKNESLKWAAKYGVQVEAWAPFAEGRGGLFTNPELTAIGENHGKSVGQVVLRWLIQRGIVPISKTTRKERMVENLNLFDFQLTPDEMAAIAKLDTATSQFFDHRTPESVEYVAKLH